MFGISILTQSVLGTFRNIDTILIWKHRGHSLLRHLFRCSCERGRSHQLSLKHHTKLYVARNFSVLSPGYFWVVGSLMQKNFLRFKNLSGYTFQHTPFVKNLATFDIQSSHGLDLFFASKTSWCNRCFGGVGNQAIACERVLSY